MAFQSVVNKDQAFGFVGEFAFHSPHRCVPGILQSPDASNNVIGRAFTMVDAATAGFDDVANPHTMRVRAGGTGTFAGFLVHRHEYASYGSATEGPLGPTLMLANGRIATFCLMGEIIVQAGTATNAGDQVYYDNNTGELKFAAPGGAAPEGATLIPTAYVHLYSNTAASPIVIRVLEPSLQVSSGGGGGGVTSIVAGAGINVSGPTGDVTISIPNNGVVEAMINADAVTGSKIKDGSVNNSKIAAGTVNLDRLSHVGTAGEPLVSGGADAAITTGKLATVGIANNAVTNAQVGSIDAGKVTTGTLNADRVPVLPVNKLTPGTNNQVVRTNNNATEWGAVPTALSDDKSANGKNKETAKNV